MRSVFYDCEFHEDGSTIDLISIGLVDDDGREFYGVSADFDQGRVLDLDPAGGMQLWGRMIDLPPGMPMLTHDLQQLWEESGRPPKPADPVDAHNALADARWNAALWWSCQPAGRDGRHAAVS